MSRRGSLSTTSPIHGGRRTSLGTITPNVAAPATDSKVFRRGSLKDLAANRMSMDLQCHISAQHVVFKQLLLEHTVADLPSSIPTADAVIDIDGAIRPVDAFDTLLENNLEAAPVYISNTHTHNPDGTVTSLTTPTAPASPSHPSLSATTSPHTSRIGSFHNAFLSVRPDPLSTVPSPSQSPRVLTPSRPRLIHSSSLSPTTTPVSTSAAPLPTITGDDAFTPLPSLSISGSQSHSQSHSTSVSSSTGMGTGMGMGISTHSHTLSLDNNSTSPRLMRRRSSLSLREIGVGMEQPMDENSSPCPRDCTHKSYVGFLDIRDMVSSIVYVTSNPVDEDEITYISPTDAEADASAHHVSGLEGVGGLSVDEDEAPRLSILAVMQEEEEVTSEKSPSDAAAVDVDASETEQKSQEHTNAAIAALTLAANGTDTPAGSAAAAAGAATTPIMSGGAHGELQACSEEWDTAVKEGMRKFRSGGAISVSYLARRNPFRSIRLHSSLLEVADMFRKGAHRIAVAEGGRVVDIVSQRSFVSWLQAHAKKGDMGPIADLPLKKACLGSTSVITVKAHDTVRKALECMDSHGKSGIAIVDDQGRLVGATSTRLVKNITRAREPAVFDKQVCDVMKDIDKSLNISASNEEKVMVDAGAVVMFEGEASVGDALDAMVTHNTNRVFTVDEEGFPARVVTVGDIISAAFAH